MNIANLKNQIQHHLQKAHLFTLQFFLFQSVNFIFKGRSQRFLFATFKLLPWPKFVSHFITPDVTSSHTLSLLITLYSLGWKQNRLMLATLKLVPRLQFFYYILLPLVTPYHTLSHLIPQVVNKTVFIWQLYIQFPGPYFLITSYHTFPLLITPYHTLSPRLETKPFSFANFKFNSQARIFLSHLTTPYHNLSPWLEKKRF